MKRVAVQNSLGNLKEELKSKGYDVINLTDKGSVDAIVYIDDYTGIQNMNNEVDANALGAVLINASNKSIDQIIYIIENRRYEGLFT